MTKIISVLLVMFTCTGQLYAESFEQLVKDFSKYQKAQNYAKIMSTSDKIITLFLDKKDYGLAEKFSIKLRDATLPQLSRYGYYLLGKTYHRSYLELEEEKFLDKAITNYKASVYSKASSILASLRLEKLQKDSGLDEYKFLAKVQSLGGNVESDRILRSSYSHVKNGRWELVRMYLDQKLIDVNDKLSSDGTTLLHMAVWYNKPKVVKELVTEYHALPNIKDKDGDTPLGYAKHKKYASLVRYFETISN